MAITVRGLQSLKLGKWLTADGPRGSGRLEARRTTAGVIFYFRYMKSDGVRDRIQIGAFDVTGKKGLTLDDANKKAGELSARYTAIGSDKDLRRVIEQERAERERQADALRLAAEAEAAKRDATLGALATAYVAHLTRRGKTSVPQVRSALERHIKDAAPELWTKPAADVRTEDLLWLVGAVVEAGKLREAAKLRAYLRAAYSAAIAAQGDAKAPRDLRDLRLFANPARDLTPIEGASNGRQRALSLAELRVYWNRISKLPDPMGALLRFHLLTGAQRVEQLSRLTHAAVDNDTKTITLADTKGRRKKPRVHVVPLIPAANEALKAMTTPRAGEFVFTLTKGATPANYPAVRSLLVQVVADMAAQGELEKEPFTVGDIRRTVETRLSGAGVSVAVRAHLQSHGLGGVQAKHYDTHPYDEEKRAALELLYSLATRKGASVTPIAQGKAKRGRK